MGSRPERRAHGLVQHSLRHVWGRTPFADLHGPAPAPPGLPGFTIRSSPSTRSSCSACTPAAPGRRSTRSRRNFAWPAQNGRSARAKDTVRRRLVARRYRIPGSGHISVIPARPCSSAIVARLRANSRLFGEEVNPCRGGSGAAKESW